MSIYSPALALKGRLRCIIEELTAILTDAEEILYESFGTDTNEGVPLPTGKHDILLFKDGRLSVLHPEKGGKLAVIPIRHVSLHHRYAALEALPALLAACRAQRELKGTP